MMLDPMGVDFAVDSAEAVFRPGASDKCWGWERDDIVGGFEGGVLGFSELDGRLVHGAVGWVLRVLEWVEGWSWCE